jgi:hypothetical protein
MRGGLYKCFEKEASNRGAKDAQQRSKAGSLIKEGGINNLTDQKDKQDLDEFLKLMANQGAFIPPHGELEGWLPGLSKNLPKEGWLEAMFQKMGSLNDIETYLKPESGDVWEFVENMAKWLHAHAIAPPKSEDKVSVEDSSLTPP